MSRSTEIVRDFLSKFPHYEKFTIAQFDQAAWEFGWYPEPLDKDPKGKDWSHNLRMRSEYKQLIRLTASNVELMEKAGMRPFNLDYIPGERKSFKDQEGYYKVCSLPMYMVEHDYSSRLYRRLSNIQKEIKTIDDHLTPKQRKWMAKYFPQHFAILIRNLATMLLAAEQATKALKALQPPSYPNA